MCEPKEVTAFELDGKLYPSAHAARTKRLEELCNKVFGEDYGPGFMSKMSANDKFMEAVVSFYRSKQELDAAHASQKDNSND